MSVQCWRQMTQTDEGHGNDVSVLQQDTDKSTLVPNSAQHDRCAELSAWGLSEPCAETTPCPNLPESQLLTAGQEDGDGFEKAFISEAVPEVCSASLRSDASS
eukprot:gnl/MRDRNA2_/MRDRNA2_63772_c0_seq1.p1 gnl/MRDRNA2_/MRDRNA2_63772_c0~~gnl/MRDRNA2_/MRDRNA2_63772_c0_seq1.p1  ORF type:complete len:103 (+),score=20.81 gnl/MRDRNA2_/MRDRNA2_63772_c0_seq1:175-483(+)